MNIKTPLAFFFLVILISCGRQRQVWFSEVKDAHNADKDAVVRVYLDKKGRLYPEKLYIPYKFFFVGNTKDNTYKIKKNTGCLQSYFTSNDTAAAELAAAYSVTGTKEQVFRQTQQHDFKQITDNINSLLKNTSTKTLIVFIHGFNDPNPTGDYQRMRTYIRDYKKINDAVYLEIYWDGLTANQGKIDPARIWGYSRINSAHIANTTRDLLNAIDGSARIRVITHSLGASVATGALFNTYSKWKKASTREFYERMMNTPAPQHPDIRIGMFAAAIPGSTTFKDFNHRNGTTSISPDRNNISRIVIGYKEEDFALRKGMPKKAKWMSKRMGATTLGCNYKNEIGKMRTTMFDLGYADTASMIKAIDFDLKQTVYEDEHGLVYYMKKDLSLKAFLDSLFD